MSCLHPVDAAVLADYWLALLQEGEEDAVEQHLFTCDDCGARLRSVIALAEGLRKVAGSGALQMVVSESFVKRAEEHGLRVRQYDPIQAGGSLNCTVSLDDDLLVGRMAAKLSGAKRVDLALCDAEGHEFMRMTDIPVQAGVESVVLHMSMPYAKAAKSEVMIGRLIEVDEAGVEQGVGEYTFSHTRTIAGPGV